MPFSRTSREDIVITGMACRFAESPDLAAFWRNVMQHRALFTPLAETASPNDRPTPRKPLFDRPFPLCAGQLNDLYACNPSDQYFPRKLNAGENQDVFFAVQLAIDALRDSGSTINNLPTDRVSLRLGYAPPFNSASINWLQHTLFIDQTLDIIRKFFPGAESEQIDDIRTQLTSSLPDPTPMPLSLRSAAPWHPGPRICWVSPGRPSSWMRAAFPHTRPFRVPWTTCFRAGPTSRSPAPFSLR
jgi:hypothetical protein